MGCGCGDSQKAANQAVKKFEVTTPNGGKIVVRSEAAAKIAAKKSGGTYQPVS